MAARAPRDHPRVLAVDVGGSHVKVLLSTGGERRRFPSGPGLTAAEMVERILGRTQDWDYDVVSVGVPAQVMAGKVVHDPVNLGEGWAGFDFEAAFGKPTHVVNDAAMQALGSYEGGRMLFLGLGTGLGSALVADGVLEPLELAHLPYRNGRTYEDYVGLRGYERLGRKKWRAHVEKVVGLLKRAMQVDYVMLGGGQARNLGRLPTGARLGNNTHAIRGGIRLWDAASRKHGACSPPAIAS
jgi:polyphosphate glucokinase